MKTTFDQLPDDARLWVYALDRPLTGEERARAVVLLDDFVAQWTSHEVPVAGAWVVVEDRFILVAGHCTDGVSGCSTDASVRVVKEIERVTGARAFDRSLVFFRDGDGRVTSVPRAEFQAFVEQGRVTADTRVFDGTIHSVGDLRAGRFERSFGESWHARAFAREAT
ncbi:MAG: hypothetical protein OEO21_03705 [Candidatus Krumholzibacteria bacterium]|nr:hypothetical protein [Candidatus Krumholzibacteria bacterium]